LVIGASACGGNNTTSPSSTTSPQPVAQPTPPSNPDGFVRGSVSDTAFRPLDGAGVEVVDGPLAGMSTTADANGSFSLSGTFDDATRFRATMDGHPAATQVSRTFPWLTGRYLT